MNRKYAERVSKEMGLNGEINQEVLMEVSRRLNAAFEVILDAITGEPKCPGCGRPELHKTCPAWGTPKYMSGELFTEEDEKKYKAQQVTSGELEEILKGNYKHLTIMDLQTVADCQADDELQDRFDTHISTCKICKEIYLSLLLQNCSSDHEHEFDTDGGGCRICGKTVSDILDKQSRIYLMRRGTK